MYESGKLGDGLGPRRHPHAYFGILKTEFRRPASGALVTGPSIARPDGELRAIARLALAGLEAELTAARNQAADVRTRAHIDDLRSEIGTILAANNEEVSAARNRFNRALR